VVVGHYIDRRIISSAASKAEVAAAAGEPQRNVVLGISLRKSDFTFTSTFTVWQQHVMADEYGSNPG